MRALAFRLLLLSVVFSFAPFIFAHDITVSGTVRFSSLDGSADDHDGLANGVFTVSDGDLIVNGTITCSDDPPLSSGASACSMAFNVSRDLIVNSGGSLVAENLRGSGDGGNITMTVGRDLILRAASGSSPAALISTASIGSSSGDAGNVTATVSRASTIETGATISAASKGRNSGSIQITSGGQVSVDGLIASGASRTVLSTKYTGAVLDGGNGQQQGGTIRIKSTSFLEPGVTIGSNAVVASQSEKEGAILVSVEGCGVTVRGLVAAVSNKKNVSARVVLRSGKGLLVESQDLGATGTRFGRVRADSLDDDAVSHAVDIFAGEAVQISGPTGAGSLYSVSASPGTSEKKIVGGTIRVLSLNNTVTVGGRAFTAGVNNDDNKGGLVSISAKGNINLATANIAAVGDYSKMKKDAKGGTIAVRSHSGNIVWTNGVGDVRPVGSGAPASAQGTITLTACGTITTSGSTFPTNGAPVGPFPTTTTGACSPAAPSLPVGEPSLQVCNTPPVANDQSVTTNEDTTITITLNGSDADGDTLTFTIQTGPLHGSLGPIVPTGPTSATVNYSPSLNYNGPDSFVFKVDDGNGGTDTATVTITVGSCNDAPSFLAGPNQVSNEDAGPQTANPWATSISPGPADEAGQSVTFSVTGNSNPSLFSAGPSVAPNGTLTYTAAANANGSATITIVAQDNGPTGGCNNNTSAPQSFTITVNPVNDPPSFTPGGNVTVAEDSGAYSASWATSISPGPANESGQSVSFNVSNNNNALFSAQPSISPSGVLTFTPAANANGSATVTVSLSDNGGIANGGNDTSPTVTFTITVTAVNDPPSFTSGGNVTVNEDSGPYSSPWASAISPGPPDESGQSVSFNVSNDNNALFTAQPSISPSGVLSFSPALNAFGVANVTVTLTDNGGGTDTSAPQTFVLTINPVNDAPSFTPGGNVTVNEDSGAYSASWATAISAGPANESSQNVSFNVSNNNNALFSVQPSISPSGVLSFTPAADANGTATVTVSLSDDGGVANGGVDTSAAVTFTITVNAVNDPPSFTSGGNVTVNEDSGAYSAAWATSISAGPADESGQTVSFNVSNDNNALFSVQPSISPSGVLTFTPAANAYGSANVTVTLTDNGGGTDTSAPQTFVITVNAVNDAPSFTPGGNVTVNEDSGAYAASWATSISAGPNESGQNVSFNVSNDNNALFSVQPSISPSGVLSFTPAPNANGSATVTVSLSDDGGVANGGVDTSPSVTFVITVNPVNDAPSFNSGGNVTVNEDSGAYSAPWATSISAGPADEAGQTLTFNITGNTNAALFSVQPSISPSGVLTFTVAANSSGSADITVVLQDNGGIANGGVDTSAPVTFTIFVTAVNDPPVNTVPGPQTVAEDNNLTFSGATAISVSDADAGANPIQVTLSASNGTMTLSTTAGLAFSVGDGSADATMTFTGSIAAINTALNGSFFSPTPNFYGPASVTITSNDLGNTGSGGPQSDTDTILITVTPVNDGPTTGNDAWDTLGNTELRVDLTPGVTPNVADTTPSTRGVLDNDADTAEGDPIIVSGIVGCADVVAPYDCVLPSGSRLSMQANGSFSFTPAPGLSGSDTFVYTATDIPSAGSPASANGTVVITLFNRIWYVNGSAAPGGDGTSSLPFTDFASLNGAGGAGDVDSPADYVFVHSSNVNGGIELEADQHLLGEGVGLSINQNLNGNGAPANLVPAGAQPNVTNGAGNAVSITSALPIEVRGLSLAGSIDAIDVTATGVYSGSSTVLIASNTIRSAGADGIDVNAGATGSPTFAIQNNIWNPIGPHTANGIDVRATTGSPRVDIDNNAIVSNGTGIFLDATGAGTLTAVGFSGNAIDGNTGVTGISASNTVFDAVPGGAFNTVSGGNTSVGSAGNPVPAGMILTNVSGDLAFTNLDVYSNAGVALRATAGVSGFRLASSSGTASAIGGPAVDLTGVNSALQLSDVSSANSGTAGVSLTNTTGSFTATGGSITNATGADFSISGGNANVAYAGTITDDVGSLVNVSGATGGTIAFSGAITDGDDGDGNGISLTGNSGATIRFSGGVVLSTGTNNAFTATGGGTLEVCDENPCNPGATGAFVNKITTAAGSALNVSGTSIGANNLEFRSISSNGGSNNGIILSSTGNSGGLKVKGNGGSCTSAATCTGGAIQNKTGANGSTTLGSGIYLNNTVGVSLDRMQLNDFQNYAIRGTNVTGFSLTNSIVNGANGSTNAGGSEEDSIRFDGLLTSAAFPTAQITDSTISGGFTNNVRVVNTAGTLNRLVLRNDTFGLINAANGNDNVFVSAAPPSPTVATANVTLENCTFLGTRGDFFETIADGNSTMDVVARQNKFTNGQAIVPGGGTALSIRGDSAGTADNVTFELSCNNVVGGQSSTGIFVAKGNGGGTWSGAIFNNTVGPASGAGGDGIFVRSAGSGTISLLVQNNTVTGYGNVGIHLQNNDGSATMNATLFGNIVSAPHANAFAGLFVDNGATGTDTSKTNIVVGSATVAANKNDFSAGDPFDFSDVSLSNFGASTVFNLSRNGSAGATANQVIDDDNLNPAATNTDTSGGAGAITLVNTLPTVPPTPSPCSTP